MSENKQGLTLGEAAKQFLSSLSPEEKSLRQQEVNKFVRWYSSARLIAELAAPEVANYAEQLSLSDTDYARKLELVRGFLAYAKKEDLTKTNMAVHLKAKKKPKTSKAAQEVEETAPLSPEGYAKLEAEIAELKGRRGKLLDDMRSAAADKDFSENAPLDAVKEERGHVEGRIQELEEALKSARVVGKSQRAKKVDVGDSVSLLDLLSNEEVLYTIVSPREIDPAKGKISDASPIGKALIGHTTGDTLEITVPAGKLRYQIKAVKR